MKWLVGDGWLDAIEPGALVGVTWCGECSTTELLTVEPVWTDFGVVLALRKRIGQRFTLQFVACGRELSPYRAMACAGVCGTGHSHQILTGTATACSSSSEIMDDQTSPPRVSQRRCCCVEQVLRALKQACPRVQVRYKKIPGWKIPSHVDMITAGSVVQGDYRASATPYDVGNTIKLLQVRKPAIACDCYAHTHTHTHTNSGT